MTLTWFAACPASASWLTEVVNSSRLVIYMFDLSTAEKSHVESELSAIREANIPYIMIGNKTDTISPESLAEWKSEHPELQSLSALNKEGISVSDAALSAIDLAALIGRIDDNTLSSKMAKDVFDALWQGETNVDDIIDRKGLKQVSDSGALEAIVNALINDNAAQVEQYRVADEGKQKKLIGFFVGQAMKASKGQANPQLLNQLLKEKLG